MGNKTNKISACICCGSNLTELMVLKDMPSSAQNIPTREEIDNDKPIELCLCQCSQCGLPIRMNFVPVRWRM